MKRLFCDGLIYDTEKKEFIRADILTDDTKIIRIEEEADILEADEIVDCSGKYIIPGFVDVHSHGRTLHDFNTTDTDGVRELRDSYAKVGTTTFMATLASATKEELFASMDAIAANRDEKGGTATIGGVHLEGRYLNEKRRGAHATHLLAKPDAAEINEFIDKMLPAPFHVSAALELADKDFYDAVISRGGTLGIAHSDATYDEALVAIENGATAFTHTFNAMRPIHHREPGNITAALLSDAYTEVICDGFHVNPAVVKMLHRIKSPERLVLITDSMEATGATDGEYSIAGQKVFVVDGKAVNAEGAIAGSTLDLHTALKNFMRFCDLSLEEALPAATLNPAKMVHLDNVCGMIAEGLRADLIIIDSKKEVNIEAVYAAGEKV